MSAINQSIFLFDKPMRYHQSINGEFNDLPSKIERRVAQLCIENVQLGQKYTDLEIGIAELKQDKADLVIENAQLREEFESICKALGTAKECHDDGLTFDLQHILDMGG